ncbi:HNH endonuclease signature motif containing protein [Amycolatopsis sp. Hca4]|uniref:HNH endonuclease signature motif containing protein n=1 Tax=Amycolatopsis sp. Hca4 TaxID=2742131 RepID=UPI001590CA1F|nr:HNH endonuclease signature motif containing protein [Amycolatopsis sp. Hca4]QKV77260.1 HNH endonuclease [Amycolatopsis sp. Hca4]
MGTVLALGDLTDRDAVLRAVQRYDELGSERFLSTYGFKPAREYVLQVDGKLYDSKAIVGVAHGLQHPELGPLTADRFSGGAAGAARRLERLGFTVSTPARIRPPQVGEEHPNRTAVREIYGGNGVTGILRFPGDDAVNVFSDEEGPYADEPPDPIAPFEYRGDGRQGHQKLIRGNKMLDTARQERRAVRFWYRPAGGSFSFVSWVAVLDRAQVWALDDNKEQRLEYSFLVAAVPDPDSARWPAHVLDRLNDRHIIDQPPPPAPPGVEVDPAARARSYLDYVEGFGDEPVAGTTRVIKASRNNYRRSRRARDAVLIRAADQCENDRCTGMPADTTAAGNAILEVDHVDDLALGGPDHPARMIALCPNCHATKTRGRNRAALRRHLRVRAKSLHRAALGLA